jgi:N-acetylglucosaminyldiphosphoundecaprenol N-acetyl-beta-D-mannosaminyltransferase
MGEFELGPVLLTDCTEDQATAAVRDAITRGTPLAVHLCNAFTLTLAARDATYADSLRRSSLNLIDGTPVAWYYRLLTGSPAQGPVRGPSFMRRVLAESGLRHVLFGGSPEVLDRLRKMIVDEYPRATIVGAVAPSFGPLREEDFVDLREALASSPADVVWVGLGTPKQDYIVDRAANELGAVAVGVGAAFDFLSGTKREAPAFLHRTGFEWLHRLATEPRRLWRRYLFGNAQFLWLAARELRHRPARQRPTKRGIASTSASSQGASGERPASTE